MFRFGTAKKTPVSAHRHPDRFAGLDANASRARAVAAGDGRMRPIHLDDPHDELPFFAHLERRTDFIGHASRSESRKVPHSVCSGYFALLGHPTEWRGGSPHLHTRYRYPSHFRRYPLLACVRSSYGRAGFTRILHPEASAERSRDR